MDGRAEAVVLVEQVAGCEGVSADIVAGGRSSVPSASAITCPMAFSRSSPDPIWSFTSMKRMVSAPQTLNWYSIRPRVVMRPGMIVSGVFQMRNRNSDWILPSSCVDMSA